MLIPPAQAQVASASPAQGNGLASLISLAPLLLVFVVFWLLMVRPQQKRAGALQTAIAALKKGDQVVTAGGVVGRVTKIEDSFVEVEIAANTRVRVVKSTLTEVTSSGVKPAND